jgi:phytoene synthase
MKPQQYCQQKVAAIDPAFRFSLKKLTTVERDAATAMMAFYLEIDHVVFECQEQAVAFTKLNWWRLEAAKLMKGDAVDHPVMKALQQAQKLTPFEAQRLLDMVDGMAQNLNLSPFATFEDLTFHIIQTAGIRELLIAEVVQYDKNISPEILYQLTLVLELARYIQHLRRYVRRGLIVFGEDELRRFDVSRSMLQAYQITPAIKNLLQYQLEKAELAFAKAETVLSLEQRQKLASLIMRCQMALALLHEIKASEFAVLENFISLTPLRCWWLSFRSKAAS